ncbi:hypothetical protein M5K25_002779 [Dendrobium thyrsiflorum]|uniref:Uncharacterized protein n=1 Tax=Dendrobium thyrsiflorum TaxID=117978 RepID=A0ABD0VP87_DENTH
MGARSRWLGSGSVGTGDGEFGREATGGLRLVGRGSELERLAGSDLAREFSTGVRIGFSVIWCWRIWVQRAEEAHRLRLLGTGQSREDRPSAGSANG